MAACGSKRDTCHRVPDPAYVCAAYEQRVMQMGRLAANQVELKVSAPRSSASAWQLSRAVSSVVMSSWSTPKVSTVRVRYRLPISYAGLAQLVRAIVL